MHTSKPPKKKLNRWFRQYPSIDGVADADPKSGEYGHLLLEQAGTNEEIIPQLKAYFESAHLDAREYFHSIIGIDLHPDGAPGDGGVQYPHCLPLTAKKGMFGEVLAGLVTESFKYVGARRWTVPVFLFRYHEDAERYLFRLVRDPDATRQTFGRHGSDFIGLALNKEKKVKAIIVGEAKWRRNLSPSAVARLLLGAADDGGEEGVAGGVWAGINNDTHVPHGISQLARLLAERGGEDFGETVLSLETMLLVNKPAAVDRTDLLIIAGNRCATRKPGDTRIDWCAKPVEFERANHLQVVEVVFEDGEPLIDELYQSLWR